MVKIAGIWEQGWNTPFMEFDLWEYPLRDFSVDQFYMTPITGIKKGTFLNERDTIQDILNENQDLNIVWIDELGETPLKEFIHPNNALYIIGKTQTRPIVQFGKPSDLSVRIETKPNGTNEGMLWSHQAAIIVLYDRLMKNNGGNNNG